MIIRDHYGGLISALSINIGHSHAFKAEVIALTKGLELAKEWQIKKLMVQLDNLACVTMIKKQDWGQNECSHMLKRCINLIHQDDWEVRISHIYREGNQAADRLANHGVTQLLPISFFSSAPVGLSVILNEDVRGVVMPRLIPP